jgi:hypothetical protein
MGDGYVTKAWETHFNDRELKEIEFARRYAVDFNHGTDGHIRLTIMARMAELLDGGLVPHIVKDFDPSKPINPCKPNSLQD